MPTFLLLFGAKKAAPAVTHFTGTGHPKSPIWEASGIGAESYHGTATPAGPGTHLTNVVTAAGHFGIYVTGTGAPQTATFITASGELSIPSTQYDQGDWTNRLISELPSEWFPSDALELGGTVYAILYAIAVNYPFHNQQITYQSLQTRIKTATGSSLDQISADFFGGTLPRLLGELDASFRARILANIIAPKSTIAAIQAVIDAYIAEFNPPYISATVFDAMTNPSTCDVLGVTAPDFVIAFTYNLEASSAWFLNDDPTGYLGDTTYLTAVGLASTPPDEGLDAVVREVKAEGTEPVYAILNGI